MKNNLMHFFIYDKGEYAEMFSICDKCLKDVSPKWSEKGLIPEKVGSTDLGCNMCPAKFIIKKKQ